MTPAVAGQLHKPARAPLGYIALLGHDPDGRLLLRASRWQLVPGIFNEREAYMSEKQMTQRCCPQHSKPEDSAQHLRGRARRGTYCNIENRLWNRVDVRRISIDSPTYAGEIIRAA